MKLTIKGKTFSYKPARFAVPGVALMAVAVAYSQSAIAQSIVRTSFSKLAAVMNYRDAPESENPAFGSEGRPAPLSIRADIPVVYSLKEDAPSKSGNPSLIGPVQFLKRAIINEDEGTVTLPLYQGHNESGETAWYVLTEVSDRYLADEQGLTFTSKLRYADQGKAVRSARLDRTGSFVFSKGAVNFAPKWNLVPGNGENPFPPKVAQPGSIGDEFYTPVVKTSDGVYYNAPVIAYNVSAAELQKFATGNVNHDLVHDKVVRINPANRSVTLKMTVGYAFSKPIFYLSTDANDPVAATLETSTLTPALNDANQDTNDVDSITGQPNERLAIIINGPEGSAHPFRQGINSAIHDGRDPLNVFGGVPTINLDYSPLWNAELIQWSAEAVKSGYRTRVDSFLPTIFGLEAKGVLEGFGGGPIKRSGIIINCPALARLI